MTFTPKTPAFEKAVKDSRNLKAKPDNDELLELYSLFKQGSQNPPFAEAPKPGMFDLTGKAKYKAWEKVEDEGLSAKDAQEKYVKKVNTLKEKYGFEG
ncbi:MAG: hypothetical protein LQ339_008429 [Xanthoria mediterranea]|nr:MAG: hypothetical protein LQ339_008429 [Xanthoria mediterranea]